MLMLDIKDLRRANGLRWLKWASTLCGSVALVSTAGIAINWLGGLNDYPLYTLPIALAVAGVSFAVRRAIGLKLGDRG